MSAALHSGAQRAYGGGMTSRTDRWQPVAAAELSPHWAALRAHYERLRGQRLSDFYADPQRPHDFGVEAAGLWLDYGRNPLDAPARAALLALAEAGGLASAIATLFAGGIVNVTEGRAAQHMALRDGSDQPLWIDGQDQRPQVMRADAKLAALVRDVRRGVVRGATGARFTDVVNIGIGGSDLGPRLAARALSPFADGPTAHFISNVDGAAFRDVIRRLDPQRTLFVISSKSFNTRETLVNAASAREWIAANLPDRDDPMMHFCAVTARPQAAEGWGIAAQRIVPYPDWVGGRFSLWSSVCLPVALQIGWERIQALRAGAHAMDQHFRTAPFAANMPVLLALVGLWRRVIMGLTGLAICPYEERLAALPAWATQLEMESNGKSVRADGEALTLPSAPIVWGGAGTDAQHSFFQALHQGVADSAVDFLLGARSVDQTGDHAEVHHDWLIANGLAQAQALATGRDAAATASVLRNPALVPHASFPGNRPSNVILYRQLDPATLGAILALYEHKVFASAVLLGINPFDQFGVELGKTIADALVPQISGAGTTIADPATAALVARVRALRG